MSRIFIPLDPSMSNAEVVKAIKQAAAKSKVKKHAGPGNHPSGSPQSVHGRRGAGGPAPSDPLEFFPQSALESFIEEAIETERVVSPFLQSLVPPESFAGWKYRIKTPESIRSKVARDIRETGLSAEEVIDQINDAVRYTLVFPAESWLSDVSQFQQSLRDNGWEILDSKDKNFFGPDDDYDGYNTVWTNGKQRFEMQFHTPDSYEVKTKSWMIYSQIRELDPSSSAYQDGLANMKNLLSERTHVPQGWDKVGNIMFRKRSAVAYSYYTKLDNQSNPVGLFRSKGNLGERWDGKGWVPSPFLLTASGVGGDSSYMKVDAIKAKRFMKHSGPNAHPVGSDQDVHGNRAGAKGTRPKAQSVESGGSKVSRAGVKPKSNSGSKPKPTSKPKSTPKSTPKPTPKKKPAKPTPSPAPKKKLRSTKDKPIRTGDIQEAIRLLAAGEYVELTQARQVSTLLDKLAEFTAKAEAAGQKAPNLDLCKVSVKGSNLFCQEHLGIKRVNMPQFSGKARPGSRASKLMDSRSGEANVGPEFVAHLQSMGVGVKVGREKASYLRASQMELVGRKVAGIAGAYRSGKLDLGSIPIFISKDNYVVDGHHRWAAMVGVDLEDNRSGDLDIAVIRVDMSITEVLREANEFTKEIGILPKVAKRLAVPEFTTEVPISKTDPDRNLVFGWASIAFSKDGTQLLDRQGHAIDVSDLEEAAYNFAINFRKTGEMHTSDSLGEMVESIVFTPDKIKALGLPPDSLPLGWWVGFRVPPATFAKVKTGIYKMFSIQGKATLESFPPT